MGTLLRFPTKQRRRSSTTFELPLPLLRELLGHVRGAQREVEKLVGKPANRGLISTGYLIETEPLRYDRVSVIGSKQGKLLIPKVKTVNNRQYNGSRYKPQQKNSTKEVSFSHRVPAVTREKAPLRKIVARHPEPNGAVVREVLECGHWRTAYEYEWERTAKRRRCHECQNPKPPAKPSTPPNGTFSAWHIESGTKY